MESYESLLLRDEWKSKRLQILKRDNFHCVRCGKSAAYECLDEDGNRVGFFGTGKCIGSKDMATIEMIPIEVLKQRAGVNELHVRSIKWHEKRFLVSEDASFVVSSTVDKDASVLDSSLEYAQIKLKTGETVFLEKRRQDSFRNLRKPFRIVFPADDISFLNVHHKVYRQGRFPWDYPSSDLVTLCEDCHDILHKSGEIVDVVKLTPCLRCGGQGYFPQYKHIEDGICFRCRGAKFEEYIK